MNLSPGTDGARAEAQLKVASADLFSVLLAVQRATEDGVAG